MRISVRRPGPQPRPASPRPPSRPPAPRPVPYHREKEELDGIPPEQQTQLGFFEIAIIGVPLLLTATVYIVIASPYLLPDRSGSMQKYIDNPREFTTTVRILAVRSLLLPCWESEKGTAR